MKITKDMTLKEVTKRYPEAINIFGNHRVDFCCGGAHSIEQTARAHGCKDLDALLTDLNAMAEKCDAQVTAQK